MRQRVRGVAFTRNGLMNSNPINNQPKNNMPRVRSSVSVKSKGVERKKRSSSVQKCVTLADLCEREGGGGGFSSSFLAFFEEDLIANCSQIMQWHDVKTLCLSCVSHKLSDVKRAGREKWTGRIYAAFSTLVRGHVFAFRRPIITSREKTLLVVKGKTERLRELYSFSTLCYILGALWALIFIIC